MAEKLNTASHERYLDLLNTEDFTPLVLDRDAADRSRSAADRLASR